MKVNISKEAKRTLRRLNRSLLSACFFGLPLVVATLLTGYLIFSSWNARFDLAILTKFFQWRGPIMSTSEVVLVSIDDRSYDILGASLKYPFPRRDIATALERIEEAKPRLLVLDVKFPDERTIDPAADQRIASAISKMPATIWSGKSARNESGEVYPSAQLFRAAAKTELNMFVHGKFGVFYFLGNPNGDDNRYEGRVVTNASTSQEKAFLYQHVELAKPLIDLANYELESPPTNSFINFYGSSKSVPWISVADLIKGDVQAAKDRVQGKVVVFGYHSLQFGKGARNSDEIQVPVGDGWLFGAEVHATVLSNLIQRNWIRRLSESDEASVIVILSLMPLFFLLWKPKRLTVILVIGGNLILIAGAYVVFRYFNFFLSVVLR
jgi:CHASE2 domain-containing sensor protein